MARKHEVDKINLDVYEFEPFVNEKYTGVTIRWDSDIGVISMQYQQARYGAHSICIMYQEKE